MTQNVNVFMYRYLDKIINWDNIGLLNFFINIIIDI